MDELRLAVKKTFVEAVRDHLSSSRVREIVGAKALLESLAALPGVRLAFATGGWSETARLKLHAIGVSTDGVAFASASDGLERTRIMRLAEQRAMGGAAASRRTYFGDGAWDKRASAELGYRFIAVGRAVEHDPCFDDLSDQNAVLACLREPT